MDRASDYGSEGWRFESSRVYHLIPPSPRRLLRACCVVAVAFESLCASPAPLHFCYHAQKMKSKLTSVVFALVACIATSCVTPSANGSIGMTNGTTWHRNQDS